MRADLDDFLYEIIVKYLPAVRAKVNQLSPSLLSGRLHVLDKSSRMVLALGDRPRSPSKVANYSLTISDPTQEGQCERQPLAVRDGPSVHNLLPKATQSHATSEPPRGPDFEPEVVDAEGCLPNVVGLTGGITETAARCLQMNEVGRWRIVDEASCFAHAIRELRIVAQWSQEILIEAPKVDDHLPSERHVASCRPLCREPEADVETHFLAFHQGCPRFIAYLRATSQSLTGLGSWTGNSAYGGI